MSADAAAKDAAWLREEARRKQSEEASPTGETLSRGEGGEAAALMGQATAKEKEALGEPASGLPSLGGRGGVGTRQGTDTFHAPQVQQEKWEEATGGGKQTRGVAPDPDTTHPMR